MRFNPWQMPKPNLVVFILFIVAGLYDFALVAFKGSGSSISAFMVYSGFKAPFWVFVIGCICGHLFFYVKQEPGT